MTLLADAARRILDQALTSESGIIVTVEVRGDMASPALRAKQVLYRFKQENAEYQCLQIRLSPDDPDKELWITKA